VRADVPVRAQQQGDLHAPVDKQADGAACSCLQVIRVRGDHEHALDLFTKLLDPESFLVCHINSHLMSATRQVRRVCAPDVGPL